MAIREKASSSDVRDELARVTADRDRLRATLEKVHRYTITSEGASLGYFRLVEDATGAWVTWAEVAAALSDTGRASPPQQEQK